MEHDEAEVVLFHRICRLEPEPIVKRIFGYLYFQGVSNQEMIRLAIGSDASIHRLIRIAKSARILEPGTAGFCMATDLASPVAPAKYHLHEGEFNGVGLTDMRSWRLDYRSSNGYCDDMSLEKLEYEIRELLKCHRGSPVSIASLPMLYFEKYGKTLQADGYLTESQRHGRAGYSLTRLLARLSSSIRLIDRAHGQHAVMLAQYDDPGPSLDSASRQIYLTFPADSAFHEEDVAIYFSLFGQVQDVRIPSQQRRMFGFVTFFDTETVKLVLSKRNPHYVCDARVLVKPYKEKSKVTERKYIEKLDHHHHKITTNPKIHPEFEGWFSPTLMSMKSGHHLMDANHSGSTNDHEESKVCNNDHEDDESSLGIKLPENPFDCSNEHTNNEGLEFSI